MIPISARILLHDNSDNTPPVIVDKIPGDENCIISFGGGGILKYDKANGLARIISSEILRDVADIPNYALIYDGVPSGDSGIQFLRTNERLLFERRARNFLLTNDSVIYISEKNLNTVFRHRIRPMLAMYGDRVIKSLNFIVDGDIETLTNTIMTKMTSILTDMNFSSDKIDEISQYVSKHIASYDDYFDPKYLDDLFTRILLPRISDEKGTRLPLSIAMWRVRKINIFAHCFGGYIALMLEERMQNKMRELGYSEDEMNKIQSQLLIVALNPSAPMGISKSQFISFMSGYDARVIRPENWASKFVNENRESEIKSIKESSNSYKWTLKPGFLTKQNGNVFFVKQRFELVEGTDGKFGIAYDEHNNMRYISRKFTDDGRMLATFARNILISGVKNSIAQNEQFTQLPPVEQLILDGKDDEKLTADFNQLIQNGKDFIQDAYKYALAQIRNRMRTHRPGHDDIGRGTR